MKRACQPGSRAFACVVAGVPGLEPRLTGPEPVGLPITPYPNARQGLAARVRPRSLADSARAGPLTGLHYRQALVAVQAEPAGEAGRAQERHVVAGDDDRAAVPLEGLGELPDRRH